MSWLDQIKTQLTITTGDGKSYTPQWMNAKKRLEFNIAKFQFPHVPGSLVSRKEPLGMEYDLEIYFQGDGASGKPNEGRDTLTGITGTTIVPILVDYLQATADFQTSATDKRPWVIKHPFYGQITVQPISLSIDNSAFNVSKINCTIIETISQDYPVAIASPKGYIASAAINTAQTLSTSTATAIDDGDNIPGPVSTKSIGKLQSQFNAFQKAVANAVNQTTADFNGYMNTFNQAYNGIDNLISDASQVLNLLQAVVNKPATFIMSVRNRVTLLQNQFTTLEVGVSGSMSNLDKLLYTTFAGGSIGAMALAYANLQPGDLLYASDTLDAITQLLNNYNQYLLDLDTIQTQNYNSTSSFVPDHDSLVALEQLINFTLSNLFNIALNGRQQRSIVLDTGSNWILLTHRFYGLDNADANLSTLMQQNNAGLSTLLHVPKNSKVIYYI